MKIVHRRFCFRCLLWACGIFLVLIACTTVPLTGRSQLTLVPDAQLTLLSAESYRDVLGKAKLSRNQAQVESLRRVGRRCADAAETFMRNHGMSTAHFQWEFNLIEDDATVNAWCMPGGKIAFYTGILPYTRDDAGMAVVMGHEIAHAVARHANERMSQVLLVQLGGASLSTAMSRSPAQTRDLFLRLYGTGAQVGVLLPHSRGQEAEADRIGLTIMAMAGYDPRVAPAFWQRMAGAGGGRPPEFLSTHPAPETRIRNIETFIPEAMAVYRPLL